MNPRHFNCYCTVRPVSSDASWEYVAAGIELAEQYANRSAA